MIKERFEARGTLAATVEVRRAADLDVKLADFVGEAEEKFLERARVYANRRVDYVMLMRAAERRRIRPDKITLVSSAAADGALTAVTFTASLIHDGYLTERKKVIYWDGSGLTAARRRKSGKKPKNPPDQNEHK